MVTGTAVVGLPVLHVVPIFLKKRINPRRSLKKIAEVDLNLAILVATIVLVRIRSKFNTAVDLVTGFKNLVTGNR